MPSNTQSVLKGTGWGKRVNWAKSLRPGKGRDWPWAQAELRTWSRHHGLSSTWSPFSACSLLGSPAGSEREHARARGVESAAKMRVVGSCLAVVCEWGRGGCGRWRAPCSGFMHLGFRTELYLKIHFSVAPLAALASLPLSCVPTTHGRHLLRLQHEHLVTSLPLNLQLPRVASSLRPRARPGVAVAAEEWMMARGGHGRGGRKGPINVRSPLRISAIRGLAPSHSGPLWDLGQNKSICLGSVFLAGLHLLCLTHWCSKLC